MACVTRRKDILVVGGVLSFCRCHISVVPIFSLLNMWCLSLLWPVRSLKIITCSCLLSWKYASSLLYPWCSFTHLILWQTLICVLASLYLIFTSVKMGTRFFS